MLGALILLGEHVEVAIDHAAPTFHYFLPGRASEGLLFLQTFVVSDVGLDF